VGAATHGWRDDRQPIDSSLYRSAEIFLSSRDHGLVLIGHEEKHLGIKQSTPIMWPKPKRKNVTPSVTVESVVPAPRAAVIASLHKLLGERLSTAALVREKHGRDASWHPCVPPDAVAFAQSTEEASEIVKICAHRERCRRAGKNGPEDRH
jgi:hypothetical protein